MVPRLMARDIDLALLRLQRMVGSKLLWCRVPVPVPGLCVPYLTASLTVKLFLEPTIQRRKCNGEYRAAQSIEVLLPLQSNVCPGLRTGLLMTTARL